MKRYFVIMMSALGISTVAHAQKIKDSDVPVSVKTSFLKLYPQVTPNWEKEDQNFEAGFKMNDNHMSVLFSKAGSLLEREMAIRTAELPSSVVTYLKTNYKDKKITEASKITKADGTINYEAEVDQMDLIFDSKGDFIRKQKD